MLRATAHFQKSDSWKYIQDAVKAAQEKRTGTMKASGALSSGHKSVRNRLDTTRGKVYGVAKVRELVRVEQRKGIFNLDSPTGAESPEHWTRVIVGSKLNSDYKRLASRLYADLDACFEDLRLGSWQGWRTTSTDELGGTTADPFPRWIIDRLRPDSLLVGSKREC